MCVLQAIINLEVLIGRNGLQKITFILDKYKIKEKKGQNFSLILLII